MTRGYQMRRHARRMRRYGFQPMIFMSHDELDVHGQLPPNLWSGR